MVKKQSVPSRPAAPISVSAESIWSKPPGRGTPLEQKARDGSSTLTNRMTESQWASWDQIWREFQKNLAKRSSRAEFQSAYKSGHWIQRDQPELVVQAIRDFYATRR